MMMEEDVHEGECRYFRHMPYTLSTDQKEHYRERGYVHLPGVYTPEAVDRARELIAKDEETGGWHAAPHATDSVTTDIYERMPELADIVFNGNYLQAMEQLFGDETVILAEPAIHRGRYYYWHKDSTFLDAMGEDFHWREDFSAAMTVLYLQENHPDFGGGITVVPGTHRDADWYHRIEKMNLVERAVLKAKKIAGISHYNRMDKHPELTPIPSKKGDLLVLDMRIDHKGTPKLKPVPHKKYGIMNIACSGNATAERLRSALRRRPFLYYSEYLAGQPETTPQLERKEREHGVTIKL